MSRYLKKINKFITLQNAYIRSKFGDYTPFVRVLPTDECNLKCKYCWQRRETSDQMTLGEFGKYLAKAKQLKAGIITFLGGEPMFWPHIYEAIKMCTEENILTDMTTNGTLLNRENIEKLGRAGLDYLNISVDGLFETSVSCKNAVVRENILENLKNAKRNYGVHFRINAVMYKNNFEQIKKLVNFAEQNNIQISLGYIVPPLKKEHIVDPNIYFRQEDKALLDEIIKFIIEHKKQGHTIIDPEQYFTNIYKYLRQEKFWKCNYPTRYGWVNIAPDGRIRSCTKKMDELNFTYLDLDSKKIRSLRKTLEDKTNECNIHCYSNCAFDSYFYTHNKLEFFKKVLRRIYHQ
jgi:MoaA/NifB/PqqE/SkfB family radical SAM enzyme